MILAQRNLINAGWSRCLTSHHWIFLTLVLALPTTGCSNSDQDNSNPLVSTTERGPYQLSVAANQGELTFGDPLTVTLKITTPPDTEVSFPKSEAFDPLEVTSTRIEPVRATESGELFHTATFDTLPTSTGEVEIPELTVEYQTSQSDPNSPATNTLELRSEPITVTVASVLAEGDSVSTPRDITGLMTPPAKPNPWFWPMVIAIAVGVAALVSIMAWWIIKQVSKPPPPIPADVWAMTALDKLTTAGLIQRGQTQSFYYQLSEIVRGYIERQFDIAAPEMTTDEFLTTAVRDTRQANVLNTDMLRGFLDACDLVKYAAFVPDQQAADDALTSARQYVRESTKAKQQAQQVLSGHAAEHNRERAA
jgi:hypothetical protein